MNKLVILISESYQEMVNKVTWPSLNSLQSSSVLVLIASLIFALFTGLIDLGFENVMSLFLVVFKVPDSVISTCTRKVI